MNDWLRRLRGAIGMGLTRGIAGFRLGMVVELVQEIVPGWNGAIVDIWPMALGLPAFLGGVAFSGVLAIAGRNRRFDELSLPWFAVLGAAGGLLVGLIPAVMVMLGLASVNSPATLGRITAVVAPISMLLCSACATGTLLVARYAESGDRLSAGDDVERAGLSPGEKRELLGEGERT